MGEATGFEFNLSLISDRRKQPEFKTFLIPGGGETKILFINLFYYLIEFRFQV